MGYRKLHKGEGGELYILCSCCKKMLPTWDFNKRGAWFYSYCKECNKAKSKEYYNKNKDRALSLAAAYREEHREECRIYAKQYREKYPEKKKETNKTTYNNHKEERKQKVKDFAGERSKELWFSRTIFHNKAKYYSKSHRLNPYECQLCGEIWKCNLHHPSYSSFDKRKEVVFLCPKCHKNIHEWNLECPEPVDLIQLNAHMPTILTDKDLECLNKNKILSDENEIV